MIRTTAIGNVTRDIVLKTDAKGRSCASFSMASHRLYHNAEGVCPVDFLPVKVHGHLAELCAKHIGKGSLIAASGDTETYPNREDPNRKETVLVARAIQFLLPRKNKENPGEEGPLAQAFDLVDIEELDAAEDSAGEGEE